MKVPAWPLLVVASVLLAGRSVAAVSDAPLGPAESAALAALRGDPERARALLAPHQEDPAALVVLASVALEEGKLADASTFVARLRKLRPGAEEGRLLEALVIERRQHPLGEWFGAGLAALKAVHPLPASPPVLDLWDRVQMSWVNGMPLPEDALRKLSSADAFLVRWQWPRASRAIPDDLRAAAVRLASSDERLLVHLAVLDALRPPGAVPQEAAAARRALVEKLRRREPGAALLLALDKHSDTEPVSEEEIAAIESVVSANKPALFAQQYFDLLRVFEKVDPALAPGLAMGGAVTLVVGRYHPGPLGSRLALKPLLPEAARVRLARALVRLAAATEREGLLLTEMLAAATLGVAHSLSPDSELRARVEALRAEGLAMQDASRCLRPLMRLPIRSLQRAWADEVPRERTLLYQRMYLQGLSCPEAPPSASGPADRGESDTRDKAGCPDEPPK